MPNVLVTGSNGQLGCEIKALVNPSLLTANDPLNTFYFTDRTKLDVTDPHAIENFCSQNKIQIIINCAAYTAVDKAEEDTVNANAVNHLAVKYLAEIAKERDIKLIHISTDYVFDGKNHKPYNEEDATNPQCVYGKTKLLGEEAIKTINPKGAIIIRTSWVYSNFGNNFIKTMLKLSKERDELSVIFDQIGTPTYARDLATCILGIIQNPSFLSPNTDTPVSKVEIYNFSNEGVCSWYDFAKAIFELSDIECKVNPIETKEYPTPAKRPHYSLLNKLKIKKTYNITIPYWKDALKRCLANTK